MKKNLVLVLIVIVSIGLIYALVHFVKMDGLAFAWSLNFLLMLCVFVFTETQKSPLASSYYNEKGWERRGKIYEQFGINFYRKLLVWIGWEKMNKKAKPVEKNTQSLMNLHHETKKAELGHLIALIVVLGFNIFVAYNFGILKSMWLLALNILLNLYPVLLQRYNRPRIERAISISKRR